MERDEIIGQEGTWQKLLQMSTEKRLPHALMLCGPSGSGKMALALAFASYLLGERYNGQSVINGEYAIRNTEAMLAKWEHPDLHFTYPVIRSSGTSSAHRTISDDFAKEWRDMLSHGPYFSLDQWLSYMDATTQQAVIFEGESDSLLHKLSLKSSQGGYKISLIWLPERMNAACANKMLKLLEEPPQQTVFLLVSEQPELLLETIRSRVQRIDIPKIDDHSIEEVLVKRRGLEPETAKNIARTANGSWLKAIEEIEATGENQQFLDMFIMLMRTAYKRDVKQLKAWSEAVAAFGREREKRMLDYFMHMTRENFIYNFHKPELNYMTQAEENFSRNFARFINEANVIEMTELYEQAKREISQNANAKIVFFDMTLKIIVSLMRK